MSPLEPTLLNRLKWSPEQFRATPLVLVRASCLQELGKERVHVPVRREHVPTVVLAQARRDAVDARSKDPAILQEEHDFPNRRRFPSRRVGITKRAKEVCLVAEQRVPSWRLPVLTLSKPFDMSDWERASQCSGDTCECSCGRLTTREGPDTMV